MLKVPENCLGNWKLKIELKKIILKKIYTRKAGRNCCSRSRHTVVETENRILY